jgi:hypothetical protein
MLTRFLLPGSFIFLLANVLTTTGCGDPASDQATDSVTVSQRSQVPAIKVLSNLERETVGSRVRPVQWQIVKIVGQREIVISSQEGYCFGNKPLRYEGVQLRTERDRIYIRPYIGEGRSRKHVEGGGLREICGNAGDYLEGRVRLPKPARDVRLYDATATPPVQRWPERKGLHTLDAMDAQRPVRGRPVQWKVMEQLSVRKLRIGSGYLGWCPEIPHSMPRFVAVHERRRPDGLVLTAYIVGGPRSNCLSVVVKPQVVVELDRPLGDDHLYDGSKSPAIRRWPK